MRFVCESCRAQYMINDEKVGPKGVKVRCRKCGYVILVKRGDNQAKGPAASAPADPDDALATQILQNPLSSPLAAHNQPSETLADLTNPGFDDKTQQRGEALLGDADEDEIGAVFDQVLNSGAHSISKDALGAKLEERPTSNHAAVDGEPLGGDNDDRMSTRVIDASVVKKLAEESGDGPPAEAKPEKAERNGHTEGEVPLTDWFVAIDEKQTGPLTLEKMKEHWDRGEIGPDSLCWRAGFTDWVPLSEVAQLASVLAPRPASKPIVMNAPVGPSVVSMPVESAFSAGGMMKSVRSEVQVPMGASPVEDTGSWKPSAANALASLVKDEMAALSRPAPKMMADDPSAANEVSVRGMGLLDLPGPEEKPATNGRTNGHAGASVDHSQQQEAPRARPAPPPANPYVATPGATYSSPGITQYRPESNRNLLIGIGVGGGVIVLMLFGLVIFLAGRQPAQPAVQPPPVVVAQAPTQPAPAPAVAPPPVVAAAPVAPQPAAVVAPPGPAAVLPPEPPKPALPPRGTNRPANTPRFVAAAEKAPAAEKAEKPKAGPKEERDEFADAFGDPTAKKETAKPEPVKKVERYIPPAPGQGNTEVKDSLSQADVMDVVINNKPALARCVEEQKKKEPGVTGKLVMKWNIQTSGRTSGVSVQSEEFKSTYMAGCVGGLIKSWTFPKHKTAGDPVVFPFKF